MAEREQVRSLLEEALNSGRTPDEVCVAHPELLDEVRRRWLRIQDLAGELDRAFPSSAEDFPRDRAGDRGEPHPLPSIPGYALEDVIGHGGMGVVYRARHIKLDRVVAVKMLRFGEYAPAREIAGLVREAQSIAGLKHPHIVQVHDVGDLNGLPYFTMEFVEGGSLAELLSGVPQAAMKAAEWMSVLAHAVHAAHERGIVHRDLKPGNVLVSADGTLKITDFGLARRHVPNEAVVTIAPRVGTPSYMPPEQALGTPDASEPTADIYSLGAILYEMLTGRPPFRGESPAETERQVVADEPVPPSRLNPRTPRDLQTICLKCLQKSPERRYLSAHELALDLDRFRRGEPIRARPVGLPERGVKWARRRPTQAALVAAGILMIAAGFAVGLWYQGVLATRRAELAFRESESRKAINGALAQVAAAIDDEAWSEAELALGHATERSAEAHSTALDGEIESLGRAIRHARSLEETRQSRPDVDLPTLSDAYAANFREIGVPIDGDRATCVEFIRASPIRWQLIVALDHRASIAYERHLDDACERFLAIAREADEASAWRNAFRVQSAWADREALLRLAVEAAGDASTDAHSVHQIGLLGIRLGQMDAPDVGAELLRDVLGRRPGDFWMNWELGICCLRLGRHREAISPLRAAVAVRPGNSFACNLLGLALAESGDLDEGVSMFRRAVSLAPGSAVIRWNLLYVLCKNGRWGEAEAEYAWWRSQESWRDLKAGMMFVPHLRATHRYEEALALVLECRGRSPNDTAVLGFHGACLLDLGRVSEAEAVFREWARLQPADGKPHAWLNKVCYETGRTDEAIAEGHRALAASVNIRHLESPFAETLLARGRLQEASVAFEQWTQDAPLDATAWLGLARTQLGARRFDQARTSLERATLRATVAEQRQEAARLGELSEQIREIERRDPTLPSTPAPGVEAAAMRDIAEWNWRCAGNASLALTQFQAALAADPGLADIHGTRTRFHAACAALATAETPTSSPDGLAPDDRARLRGLAFDWLSSEREAMLTRRGRGATPEQIEIAGEFRSWLREPALAGVRSAQFVGLPHAESEQLQRLWTNIRIDAGRDNPDDSLAKARFNAGLSDWRHALENYTEVFRLEPSQDGEIWFELAAVQLLANDLDGYRRTCAHMLESRAAALRIRAYHAARACTLAPLAGIDMSRATEVGMTEIQASSSSPWALTEYGALECRAGRGASAIPLLKRSIEGDPRVGMAVLNWLWLTLANDSAGNPVESRRWFDKAETWFQRLGNEQPPAGSQSSIHLHNWLEAQVLRREASACVAASADPG
jgi:serine/threonine-protein kinase